MNLTEKAMLVTLSISEWSARKLDKNATAQVIAANDAQTGAGRFNKSLVAKEALKAVSQSADAARDFHYANTMPWKDKGPRLLPSANFLAYTESMRQLGATYNAAVDAFCAAYPDSKEAARLTLGDMFQEADYPSVSVIRRKFSFVTDYDPIQDAGDFRVQLGAEEEDKIRASIEARCNAALENAVRDVWNRVHEVVGRMAERLRLYSVTDGKIANPFRDSLVENVREMADLLPRLNVTDDPAMSEIADRIKSGLCSHDPQEFRDSSGLRNSVADEADAILAAMAGYCGDVAAIAA